MRIKGFGVSTRRTDGNFSRLENQLIYLKEADFEYLEVSADVVDIIGGGKIIPKRRDKLLQLLERYGFKYTAHIHNGIDLSDDPAKEFLFREAILKGLEYAKKWKLKIGIENIEIDKLSKVVDFVKGINEPDIILVLDVGHAFLSEHYFGENFLESVKKAASMVSHIHLSDNFGRFEKMRLENFDLY